MARDPVDLMAEAAVNDTRRLEAEVARLKVRVAEKEQRISDLDRAADAYVQMMFKERERADRLAAELTESKRLYMALAANTTTDRDRTNAERISRLATLVLELENEVKEWNGLKTGGVGDSLDALAKVEAARREGVL